MPNSDVELALCEAMDAAGRDYEQAVRQIEGIAHTLASGEGHAQSYERLQQIALETRDTEYRVVQLQDNWKRLRRSPGVRLQQTLRRQEGILRELIDSLNRAEQIARSSRGGVLAAVDETVKTHQMHSAYARTIRQAVE
ncbi:MAG: hypothetical protein KF861_07140 [Planctomycetaceae bacterium]|nr:hypothetical protein [Planctomycetaceae bacterium]